MSELSEFMPVSAIVTNSDGVCMDAPELAKGVNELLACEMPEDLTRTPPVARDGMFPPLLKAVSSQLSNGSEATMQAVSLSLICRLCAIIGRPCEHWPSAPWYRLGDSQLHLRPFCLLVGPSAYGRKGTSDTPVKKLFEKLNDVLFERHSQRLPVEQLSTAEKYWNLHSHTGGLSSGEGVIWRLRDDILDPKTEEVIPGEPDKRLFVLEPEFGNILHQSCRDGNILSVTIRRLWDGESLSPLTKRDRIEASSPHVCLLCHITDHELLGQLKTTDTHNGLMNRCLTIYSRRERLVAHPVAGVTDRISEMVDQLADVIEFAWSAGEIVMSESSRDYWTKAYNQLCRMDMGERINALMSRAPTYALMLAMLFCLMDKRKVIEPEDIKAALFWLKFWLESLSYLFDGEQEKMKADNTASLAEKILAFIREKKTVTRTMISNFLQRNYETEEIQDPLESLLHNTPPLITMTKKKSDKGRTVKIYTLRI